MSGRLALWHGPPGTGKTWALRALGREWNGWCDLHYVTDPERLLGGDTGYMLSVLASRSEPQDDELDDLRRGRASAGIGVLIARGRRGVHFELPAHETVETLAAAYAAPAAAAGVIA